MEININPKFGDMYVQPEETSTSSFLPNESLSSSFLSHVGNRDGSCYANGTREYEGFYRTAQFVTGLIIYPILCIVGIIGNSLSIIVLSHKDMATPTNVYLLALGVSDSLKLLNDFLYFVMLIISLNSPGAAESMMVNVYPYAHYIFQIAVCVTAWLTVSVAMDRYVSVCHPSRAKSLCTIVRARSMVITVYVIMILISIPSAFRYRLQTVHDTAHNITCMELVVTELGRNKEFMIPYTWAQNLLRGIIPVFILIFLNARIINVLRKERVRGKKFSARNRITIMLIAMVLVFIVCITPDAIMSTFFGKGYVEEGFMVKGVREITDSLLAFNSAINFVLYCSLSNMFRATFVRVFFGKRYMTSRSGSCRNASTYCAEPATLGPNGFDGGDSLKKKNGGGGKSKTSFRGVGNDSNGTAVPSTRNRDSPERKYSAIEESDSETNWRGKNRSNSLCYTDHNDHLYAEMSGVWLGPAPKDVLPKLASCKERAGMAATNRPSSVVCEENCDVDDVFSGDVDDKIDDVEDSEDCPTDGESCDLLDGEQSLLVHLLQDGEKDDDDGDVITRRDSNRRPVSCHSVEHNKERNILNRKDSSKGVRFHHPRRCQSATAIDTDLVATGNGHSNVLHTTSLEPLASRMDACLT